MVKTVYCKNCGHPVQRETRKWLRKEYPYYCPHCDENMYQIETYKKVSLCRGVDMRKYKFIDLS